MPQSHRSVRKLSKKGFAILALLLAIGQLSTAQILKTMRRLPDTGQTQSFTNTPGEDSDFTQNPPFFHQNGDGTATDTVTGLMWQQTDGGEMTIENAVVFCENLTLGGHDDWRLPTARESFSILNHGAANPALDGAIFTNTNAEYWWTSEHDATNAAKIWVTNKGGGIGNHLKTETVSAGGTKKIHVRAVRDVAPPPTIPSRFSDNGDGTVTDHLTSLIWQKVPASDPMTWENALGYASDLTLAGAGDWRLPNIKELQSLSDATLANPCINTGFFPEIGVKKYWSSTSLPNQTTWAWYLDTHFGITTYIVKTEVENVICVRNPTSTSTKTEELAAENASAQAFPNPFFDHIFLKNAPENAIFQLANAFGQVVFYGKNIASTDFSKLPTGLYLLKIEGKNAAAQRLVKI